jgi:hypothetical protein
MMRLRMMGDSTDVNNHARANDSATEIRCLAWPGDAAHEGERGNQEDRQ